MEVSQMKKCTKCGRELPIEMFGRGNGPDGRRSQCKDCTNKAAREYHKKRKEKKDF